MINTLNDANQSKGLYEKYQEEYQPKKERSMQTITAFFIIRVCDAKGMFNL